MTGFSLAARLRAGAYCASAERALAVAKRGCAISSDMAFLRAGAAVQLNRLKA